MAYNSLEDFVEILPLDDEINEQMNRKLDEAARYYGM